MHAKKVVFFFSIILLFAGLMCSVDALSDTTVSFRGAGVTIDLTYPEEAHPTESIWHNATITANTALTLNNLTVVIKAPVNSSLQEVFTGKDERNIFMAENSSFQWSMGPILLPQDANGTLYCFIYVKTSQSVYYSSYTFYATRVSELTFSEMQSLYYEMLANYTTLQANYATLLNEYNGLSANYSSLLANYTALLTAHNQLTADYNSKVSAYASLSAQYSKLLGDYDALNANYMSKIAELGDLQSDYGDLNSTRVSLQASYDTLQTIYKGLNQTYTELQNEFASLQERFSVSEGALNSDRIVMFIFIVAVAALIAFIIYLKRKKEEPYVVIRKETVSMKSDEES
jgi:predicted nuclease with TOPRIM domain